MRLGFLRFRIKRVSSKRLYIVIYNFSWLIKSTSALDWRPNTGERNAILKILKVSLPTDLWRFHRRWVVLVFWMCWSRIWKELKRLCGKTASSSKEISWKKKHVRIRQRIGLLQVWFCFWPKIHPKLWVQVFASSVWTKPQKLHQPGTQVGLGSGFWSGGPAEF